MSHRRFHDPSHHQPFAFTQATEDQIAWWERKYPSDRRASAVIPALWLAQKQNGGWLSEPALRAVADRVGMTYIRVYEIATFYTMFNLEPVGKYHLQVCGTTPCMLRGADKLKDFCERKIGPKGHVSSGGTFSWVEVECLGACVNAPMIQINDYYYEDLSIETLERIIEDLAAGKNPKPGTYVERQTSAPQGRPTSLTDEALFDGSKAEPLKSIPNAPKPAPEGGAGPAPAAKA
ncbi:MAG TPA: NADH-quinone oxidoreductase subunit NuoE [Hyphomonadaceae bacterium]|nr:NADH-quinone oxidoreductase subunit NuoE [Hyphomonadaceae bacterium]